MGKKYFGTDGVRGTANVFPLTAEFALRLGAAVGRYFRGIRSDRRRVVIGKDTRLSGYMLENALTAGLTSTGMNVLLLGPVPTPAVGYLTRSMRADLGVMITASHNLSSDNGIKLFGPDGFKLSSSVEGKIEALVDGDPELVRPEQIGRARRIDDGLGRYVEYAKTTFPRDLRLHGVRVVVDCANGAAYKAAPRVLWELGAEVYETGTSPNGHNINRNCGSQCTGEVEGLVKSHAAHLGIALDGDADRAVFVNEKGETVHGDQVLAALAICRRRKGQLKKDTLVSTIMSNKGLDEFLRENHIKLVRSSVGDKNVVDFMRSGGYSLGGEQSGHIVMSEYSTTGDGLLASLQVLSEIVTSGVPASELFDCFELVPQLTKSIRIASRHDPLDSRMVREAIALATDFVGDCGRVVVRKSGTEPLVRIMVECREREKIDKAIATVECAVNLTQTECAEAA